MSGCRHGNKIPSHMLHAQRQEGDPFLKSVITKAFPLVLAIILVQLAVVGVAGAAAVDVYADINHTTCALYDNVQPPVVYVYYFLSGATGATGVEFAAVKPACWTGATWVGDSTPYVSIGRSQTDWAIGFQGCRQGTIFVGTSAYVVSGTGTPCCQVRAHISADQHFDYADCTFTVLPLMTGTSVTINPNASCACQQPLATEATSWGRVKSLYR